MDKRIIFTKNDYERIYKRTGGKCAHCGRHLNLTRNGTIDHIFPLSKGGKNDEFNLIALCKDCNEKKSNYIYEFGYYEDQILPEYRLLYESYFNTVIVNHRMNSILPYDCGIISVPTRNRKSIEMIRNIGRRKGIAAAEALFEKLKITFFLERAYEGDAEDLANLARDNINDVRCSAVQSVYTDKYVIMDAIRKGHVFVLRLASNQATHGFFIFEDLPDSIREYPQIKNFLENTGFSCEHILAAAHISRFASDAFPLALRYFEIEMLERGIVFATLDFRQYYYCADQKPCFSFPHDFYNGYEIDFPTEDNIQEVAENSCEGSDPEYLRILKKLYPGIMNKKIRDKRMEEEEIALFVKENADIRALFGESIFYGRGMFSNENILANMINKELAGEKE